MALPSSQFCDTCGAANRQQALFCRVCGRSLRLPAETLKVNAIADTAAETVHVKTLTVTGLLTPQVALKQRYIILGQAGRGGFGAVYKAQDTQLGQRLVAVKEMSQSNLDAQELVAASEAFKHEALLLASLAHPNLPRIYEQFTEAGRSYLVMDFIEGETLEAHLQSLGSRRMPIDKVLDIGLQLCAVLNYLHTRQPPIIFRDLKPANVMLTPAGHIYLIDFGIARLFKPGQKNDTTALGSSGYAPPEQYGKSQTNARADIYSLGATLHQLLTGHDPSESPFHFEPLRLSEPALAGLNALIMNMVSVPIDKRPESIAAVQQELQRIATSYRLNPAQSGTAFMPGVLSVAQANAASNVYTRSPSPTGKKKTSRSGTAPPVYPQANTLYICQGHASRVTSVAWSPDGQYLASAGYDKTVQIWRADNGSSVRAYQGHNGRVNALSWLPTTGKQLASASDDRTVQIWDVATGKSSSIYRTHQGPVETVAWSPDGQYLASAGEGRVVQIWKPGTQTPLHSYNDHTEKVLTVAWSPDSQVLASGGKDRVVRLHEPFKVLQKRSLLKTLLSLGNTPKVLSGFNGTIHALAWSPDGKVFAGASGDSRIYIHDAQTMRLLATIETDNATIKNAIAWSPNGKYLAIAGNDKVVRIWNIASKKEIFVYYGHTQYVLSVAWSPDGTRVASGGVDRAVQVWKAI